MGLWFRLRGGRGLGSEVFQGRPRTSQQGEWCRVLQTPRLTCTGGPRKGGWKGGRRTEGLRVFGDSRVTRFDMRSINEDWGLNGSTGV